MDDIREAPQHVRRLPAGFRFVGRGCASGSSRPGAGPPQTVASHSKVSDIRFNCVSSMFRSGVVAATNARIVIDVAA
jgi:hypothetical protein